MMSYLPTFNEIKSMKKITLLFLMILSSVSYSQTPITEDNFQTAINTCLTTNPVDGLCSDS